MASRNNYSVVVAKPASDPATIGTVLSLDEFRQISTDQGLTGMGGSAK